MGAVLELALLASVECFDRAMVAHDAGVYSALGAFVLVFSQDLFLFFVAHIMELVRVRWEVIWRICRSVHGRSVGRTRVCP